MTVVLGLLAVSGLAPATAAASPESALMDAINDARADYDLRPLRPAPALEGSASRFAALLMRTDRFQHAGLSTGGRFARVGEALAYHSGWRLRPASVVRNWLRSSTHRPIVLGRFSRLGIGRSRGLMFGQRSTVWVLQVGAP
jgi:uncharacterized protein YkwD